MMNSNFIYNSNLKYNTIKKTNIFSFDKFIFLLLFNILLIDLIGGYILSTGEETSIMIIYKVFIFTLISFFLYNDPKCIVYFGLLTIFSCIFFGFHFLNDHKNFFSGKFTLLIRFNFNVFVFLFLLNRIKKNQDFYLKIKNILNFNFIIIASSIILGLFGFGRVTYDGAEIGSKGYYEGGNDIGITFLIISNYKLFNFYLENKSRFQKYFLIFFILFIAISTTTKTIIIGSFISILFITFFFNNVNFPKKILGIFLFSCLIIYIIYQGALISGLYERLFFYFELHDLWFLIFSGRNENALSVLQEFTNASFIVQFFGLDQSDNIEMDFFDILFSFGYFGMFIFFILLIYFANEIRINFKHGHPFSVLIKFLFFFIISIGMVSGHTVFSTQSGLFLLMVCTLIYIKRI